MELTLQGTERRVMDKIRLPRKLSEEPMVQPPRRPSHRKVIEDIERWANSPALRPPELPETTRDDDGARSEKR